MSYISDDPYWSCYRKRAHEDEKKARRAVLLAFERRGARLTYYPCPYCGQFHLTRDRSAR